jgi:hypothetical protein
MYGAPTEEIIRIVEKCPTDALTYKRNADIDKEKDLSKDKANTIARAEVKIMKDGPVIIKGNFKLTGATGVEMKNMNIVSLCRCGKSDKMPYCDGKHLKSGYTGK